MTEVAETVAVQLTASAPAATATAGTATPTPTTTTAVLTVTPDAAVVPVSTAVVASTSWFGTLCDVAQFVSDDTIPDGTVLSPGVAFTKTWTLKNAGYCDWTDDYQLVFVSGNQMSGDEESQLTDHTIEPGETISISVPLIAPTTAGTYTGYWALQNADGSNFGIGPAYSKFYVNIVVSSSATTTRTPTVTSTSATTSTYTPTTAASTSTNTTSPTSTTAPTDTPVPTTVLTVSSTNAPTETPTLQPPTTG